MTKKLLPSHNKLEFKMKKIVSTIIALVCFINVNAQRVEMNYENTFEPIFEVGNISAYGTAIITLNYSDVIVSINCTGFTELLSNRGVVIDKNHKCLEFVGSIEEEGAATFTVYLSDNAKQANKYIKKVTFITRGNTNITRVIGSNDAGSDTDVKFVGTNRIAIEAGFDKISEFEIDFTYSDYIQLKSIIVEYGYFDDELTLTDDSYDYFGDYRYAKKVTYTRPMNSEKWGSLCLPFNYVVDDSKFSVYTIKGAGLNGSNAPITLSKVANGTEVVAGTPMFVYCTEPNLVVSVENVLVTTEDFNSSGLIYECGTTEALNDGNENPISPSLNYTFYGTIKNVTVTDAIFVENDIFKYINGTAKTFQPYRAYFTLEDNNSGTGSLTFRVLNGSNLTSVAGVCGAEGHETDVKWELTDMDNNGSLETLTISGTGAMMYYGSALGSDSKYHSTAPWKDYDGDIKTVVVEDGVTYIGSYAFAYCTALTSVSLPSSVVALGDYVCYSSNVIRIDIPSATAATLGAGGFNYCHADLQIAVPSTLLGTYQTATNWSTYADKLVGTLSETTGFSATGFATGNYEYTRPFKCGVASTVCLPFSLDATQAASVGKFYSFYGIDKSGENWEVIMEETTNKVSDDLTANTPYLFVPYIFDGMSKGDDVEFTFSGTVSTAGDAGYSGWIESGTNNEWAFQGVYYNYAWNEGNENLGKVYGFAAQSYDGVGYTVNPGDFVKAAAGASIAPFRAFLQCNTVTNAPRRGAAENLPSRMTVRLVNADGETTTLSEELRVKSEGFATATAWFTLDGRKLDKHPTQKGIYINGNKKIVIK